MGSENKDLQNTITKGLISYIVDFNMFMFRRNDFCGDANTTVAVFNTALTKEQRFTEDETIKAERIISGYPLSGIPQQAASF